MGSVCLSCYSEKHNGEIVTLCQDESPRLCARHIQLEHGDDLCEKCQQPWREHAIGTGFFKDFVCPQLSAEEKQQRANLCRAGKLLCTKCQRPMTMYYKPICFFCHKPQTEQKQVLCLFSVLYYLEARLPGVKETLLKYFQECVGFQNGVWLNIGFPETEYDWEQHTAATQEALRLWLNEFPDSHNILFQVSW